MTGYGDTAGPRTGSTLRIDQDDRIALLGKPTARANRPCPRCSVGSPVGADGGQDDPASPKLRIGYFAQHQVDELQVADETPLDHLRRLRPDESPARLAGAARRRFGLVRGAGRHGA